jgi:phosphotriesterase-related protein
MIATTGVRTLGGDIPGTALGVVDAHDHVFFASPALPGVELNDVSIARAELRTFQQAGGGAVVQWTPAGLSRRLDDLKHLSTETGVHVIAATGRHRREHHPGRGPLPEQVLAQQFIDEILDPRHPCGLVKVATGYHHLDAWERTNLQAAGEAHRATGAPVAVHLELGTHGTVVVDVLLGLDVPAESIILGHLGRNPDPGYVDDVAARGTYVCFDGPSRANHRTDWRSPELIGQLAEAGRLPQILLGADTTTATARTVIAGPGMAGLLTWAETTIRPRIGAQALDALLRGNPRRAFVARPRARTQRRLA